MSTTEYTPQPLPTPLLHQGKVIDGEKVGRTLNFPTANLDTLPKNAQLKPGVYFGTCHVDNDRTTHFCLAYFGPRLVFGEMQNNFEVFIYDFNADIYTHQLSVQLTHFLRPPVPFVSVEKLVEQMAADKATGIFLISS